MAVWAFFDEGHEGEKADCNAGDGDCGNPFDFAEYRNLPVDGKKFEDEEEVPLGARNVGGVAWVCFGFGETPIKVASRISRTKMPSETIRSL